ncbi:MAG: hypothetical protein ABL308_01405 [Oceanicaulis sp.]
MTVLAKLAAAAGFAALAIAATPDAAEAQRHHPGAYGGWDHPYDSRRYGRWNGPEGYFVVFARDCPDLREDRRDRRYHHGRSDRREDRRDRRVLHCPDYAWDYAPSRREVHQGRYGDRLRPDVAYWDHRSQRYYVQTRWGPVPVHIEWSGRNHWDRWDHRERWNRYRHGSGVHFEFRF